MKRQLSTLFWILASANLIFFLLIGRAERAIDYRAFYATGRLANESPGMVYDSAAQQSALLRFTGETGWVPVYHPPQELLLFSTLARLPYGLSLALWSAMGVGFVLAGCKLLSLSLKVDWADSIAVSFAIFATGFSLYEGQDTLLLLFLLSAALFLLRRGRDSGAAVVLAIALFKPQIPAVVALALLLNGRRRFFGVFAGCSAAIALGSFLAMGRDGMYQWLTLIRVSEPRQQAWRMLSLRGLLSLVHAPHALAMAAAGVLIVLFAVCWRHAQDLASVFSSAIIVGSLAAHHFYAYDAAVLLVPLLCLMSASELDWLDYAVICALCVSPIFFALTMIKMSALLCLALLILAAKFWNRLKEGLPLRWPFAAAS